MDHQGHDGGGMGDWASNSFPGTWEQQFTDPALSFNPHAPQDHGYHHSHNPDGFTTAPSEHMNHHLPPPDPQRDLYNRPYHYYSEDVWPAPPSGAVSAHGASSFGEPVPHGSQGYYHDQSQQQQQAGDVHQTVDSRFALVDPPHGHEFQPSLHASHGQEAPDPYGFSTNMAQPQASAANGYLQEAVPQWQQVAGHASEYAQAGEFDNPRGLGVPAPPMRNPSPIFPSGQGIAHPAAGGQLQQQGHLPGLQSQASAATGSPRVMPQPVARNAAISQAEKHPVKTASPIPAPVQAAPALAQAAPASVHAPPAPVQAAPAIVQPAAPIVQPAAPIIQPAAPVVQPVGNHGNHAVLTVDTQLLEEAQKREGALLPGVPHLVIGDTPVKLKKGPPTKRYVMLSTKGGKPPLFPHSSRGWTLAESLGNHYEGYKAAESAVAANPDHPGDVDRYRADARLALELRISEHDIPADWWKKMHAEPAPTPEDKKLVKEIEFSEKMRLLHSPLCDTNKIARKEAFDAFYNAFWREATELREELRQNVSKDEDGMKRWKAMSHPFETILVRGLEVFDVANLRRMTKDDQKGMKGIAKLINIILAANKLGEAGTVVIKGILKLLSFNTKLTPNGLKRLRFSAVKSKLESRQDPEFGTLISTIIDNAEKNKDLDSPSPDPEMADSGSKSDDKINKAVKAPAKMVNGKRARDDDAHDDDRSGKKQATGAPVKAAPGAAKPPPAAAKLPAKSPAVPPAPNLAPGPVKRSNLLLPGKLRAPARPAVKAEPIKADISKLAAKPDPSPKLQSGKAEPAKPQAAKASASQPMVSAAKAAKAAKPKVPDAPQPSRFAALLSEIDEPKKVKAADPPPAPRIDPNETEDERKRRLRKEERRRLNLRVVFKSDDRLVEIREFTRDPEEIAASAMARDIRSENKDKMEEGAALKMHKSNELDEWEDLTAIDFSVLPAEKRAETFVTRGGLKEFETEQQKFMQDREAKELMVVYTDVADIPPTPKSPPFEPLPYFPDDAINLPDTLESEEIRQRVKDRGALGFRRAVESAQSRLAEQSKPGYAEYKKALKSVDSIAGLYNGGPAQLPSAMDLDAAPVAPAQVEGPSQDEKDQKVLDLLNSDRVKNWKDPDPFDPQNPKTVRRHDYGDPKVQEAANSLEDLVARIRSGEAFKRDASVAAAPASMPVVPAAQPVVPVAQPAQAAAPDYSAAWAQYYAQSQNQQQQHATAPAWPSQPQNGYGQNPYAQAVNPYVQASGQPAHPDANNQVSALLAALQNPANAGQQQQLPAAANDASLQTILAAVARNQPSGQQPGPVQAPAALTPQSSEFMRSLMQLTGQGQNNTAPAASYHDQGHQSGARQQGSHLSYGQAEQGGFRQPSHQERDGYGGGYDNRERERDRDGGDRRDRGFGGNKFKPKGGFNNNNQSDVPEHLRGINRNLIGTKQCTFFARGLCAKGDKCTFRHD
ncbi:hypothetical protein QBC39DRAFT_154237 [Podospora conica]|nr:hypothetical protein QBC39DRAFT_154237 [Schizothecium conicum]